MRFVGGQISHAGNAQVTTPNAVVGIRGGVGIFQPAERLYRLRRRQRALGSSQCHAERGRVHADARRRRAADKSRGRRRANFLQSVLASPAEPARAGRRRASDRRPGQSGAHQRQRLVHRHDRDQRAERGQPDRQQHQPDQRALVDQPDDPDHGQPDARRVAATRDAGRGAVSGSFHRRARLLTEQFWSFRTGHRRAGFRRRSNQRARAERAGRFRCGSRRRHHAWVQQPV